MILTAEEFIELRDNNDPRAVNDDILPLVWLIIIKNHSDYKKWILQNKNVPIYIIRYLAKDIDSEVRFWVAQKRKCPDDVIKILAEDHDASVRNRIAWNKTTKNDVLHILANDSDLEIAKIAKDRLF